MVTKYEWQFEWNRNINNIRGENKFKINLKFSIKMGSLLPFWGNYQFWIGFHIHFPPTQFPTCSVLRIALLITQKYTVSAVFTIMRCPGLTFISGITIPLSLHNSSRHGKRHSISPCQTQSQDFYVNLATGLLGRFGKR